jgi:RHS repeat-associated protein
MNICNLKFKSIVSIIICLALAAMNSPASAIAGEAAHLARDLGTTASQSVALRPVSPPSEGPGEVAPKSGINYTLYNNTFDVIEANTGILLVEDRINRIQTLATDKLVMQESGFIEIFANNDAQTPVYFDNMTVTHTPGRVLEVNTYYPYGMLIPELSAKAATKDEQNWYKFSAKELETALNLNMYDFGARLYDPVIGKFLTPDRFAEKYYSLSPYSYAGNNPINYIDINGDSLGYVLNLIQSGLGKADQFVSKAASTLLNPVFGRGSALNNMDINMKGNTYGEWEGHADGDLSGGIEKDLPDYTAVTVSDNLIVGGGVGGDLNFGYLKRDGFFVNATGRTGSGFDISVGLGLSFGSYRGINRQATATDLSGAGLYQSTALGSFSGGAWQDVRQDMRTGKIEIAPTWIGGNAGFSVGTKSLPFFTGSAGVSYTTKPFYIYKMK